MRILLVWLGVALISLVACTSSESESDLAASYTWVSYEWPAQSISFQHPEQMKVTIVGNQIFISSPSENLQDLENALRLNVVIGVEPADSPRLPDNVDRSNPAAILTGFLEQLFPNPERLSVREPVAATTINGYSAATTLVQESLAASPGSTGVNTLHYIVYIVHTNRVVQVFASTPGSTEGKFLPIGRMVAESIQIQ
jgi:hypothetical protein